MHVSQATRVLQSSVKSSGYLHLRAWIQNCYQTSSLAGWVRQSQQWATPAQFVTPIRGMFTQAGVGRELSSVPVPAASPHSVQGFSNISSICISTGTSKPWISNKSRIGANLLLKIQAKPELCLTSTKSPRQTFPLSPFHRTERICKHTFPICTLLQNETWASQDPKGLQLSEQLSLYFTNIFKSPSALNS